MATYDADENFISKTFTENDRIDWVPFSLTLVEYPKGDLLGKFFAFISLAPFAIGTGFLTLILFRRDLHTITFFMGTLFSEALNYTLKHTICEPRPVHRSNDYNEYGMPSSHSQFMWFFATYVIYFVVIRDSVSHEVVVTFYLHILVTAVIKSNDNFMSYGTSAELEPKYEYLSFRLHHMNNNTIIENVSKLLIISSCVLAAILVCISRVYLKYHTVAQVFAGIFVGIVFATFWFALTYLVFTPLFPQIVSWKISEFLLLRDTTLIPNVLWFEYTNTRQEVRARSRKLVSMKSQ